MFLRLARPAAARSVWRVGAALGLGFLAGELLSLLTIETDSGSPYAKATHLPKLEGVVSTAMFGPGIVWIVLALVSLVLFVLWTDAAAAVWLSRGGERLPRIAVIGSVVVGGAVLSVWTAMFFFAHDIAIPAAQAEAPIVREFYGQIADAIWVGPSFLFAFVWDPTGSVLGAYWFVIPAFALLWAFPLAAAARRRAACWPSWAFLGAERPAALHPQRLDVARAALTGLVAGLAAWAGTLLLRAWIHASLGAEPPTGEFRLGVAHWEYVMAMAAQTLAAGAAVLLCRRSAVLHGLLAGFVAGVVAVAGLQLNTTIRSCVTLFSLGARHPCPTLADGGIAHDDFDVVLARGALLVLVASLGTFGLVWLVRRALESSRATGRDSLSDRA